MSDEIYAVEGACAAVRYKVLGPISNNVYCIEDGAGGVIVVDPEKSAERILAMVGEAPVSAIFITHKHNDHIGALADLREATGAPVYASAVDAVDIEETKPPLVGRQAKSCAVDVKLTDGDTINVGACTWRVLATPGHTPGSLCYFLDPSSSPIPEAAPLLLSGDTLFCGTIGRTDFEGGSMEDMAASMGKLSQLPDNTMVLPGHDEITSIAMERVRTIEFYRR